ncbi:type I pantothenate kinase [Candidatus Aquiluna sp. UB-MaderosW2red]|uniref:type I pantothenate kinase n=1 Tax=Candidatus Aquiluna sp. UB-MaderosW2red TaxID=1855377 RepID=UPI000875D99E|nr:type I pantothenate kinase [Candidatus Aquiluna sp. UB-MaderosW2red]SCX06958.1 pantothenate kinase [Candidatus Aquiluna sp. UB-MaderosW2red]
MSEAKAQEGISPYLAIERADWAELGNASDLPLTEKEIQNITGLGDVLDIKEVTEVYLPISQLLSLYASGAQGLHRTTSDFFGDRAARTPFIIGIAGSVAVGKSTAARLLRELMKRWSGTPKVELVTTDGFLYPNAELERRGIMHRKGFPESYDRKRLLQFVSDIKSGQSNVEAPVYSHLSYDIVEGEVARVTTPDVLILEGLNVLQPPSAGQELALSDFFDFTIYIDANVETIKSWYLSRFEQLFDSAFTDPRSYFHTLTTELTKDQALERAEGFWRDINLPNLEENIEPTRSRATLVMQKGDGHRVSQVLLRKL